MERSALERFRTCVRVQRMDIETLEREALNLPAAQRARLAHELLESLDTLTPAEIETLWLDEAERRINDIDEGKVQLVPGDEVMRKARALIK
jgi:putative addiction module component (TIGR02574 family)